MVELLIDPDTQLVTVDDPDPTITVLWDQAVQQAVINTSPGPTVASRAYAVMHTAMFDAWAAYDPTAIATQLGDDLQRPIAENTDSNKAVAMSFAAYRVLIELFPTQAELFNDVMTSLDLDPNNTTTDTTTPIGLGNVSADALLAFRREDGANSTGDDPNSQGLPYSDTTGYEPTNLSNTTVDINLWTAETVPIDDPDGRIQQFLTPHWGTVTPFALESGSDFLPPPPEPFLLVDGTVDFNARTIALADGTVVDIAPEQVGSVINPAFITQAQDVLDFSVNLTDEQKLIAEFWEDGGGTSFPPGTWMSFGEFVSARDDHTLDDDAKLFFALGNAVFDAGIATWDAKRFYDYARPVRAIRNLGELGLIGEFKPDLNGFAIEANVPNEGVQTILATDFLTYQTPGGDPSPPFAEYVSGHSTFSAAGATILEQFTDSDDFGASVVFQPGESRFEPGLTPSSAVTLSWDTFSSAADEAGISRRYGGIHFEEGDLNGRILGRQVGDAVWEEALFFINGGEEQDSPDLIFSPPAVDGELTETVEIIDSSIVFGNTESNIFDSSQSSNSSRLYGKDGDDEFILGTGNRAFGGDGADIFDSVAGNGNNRIYAGNGDDIIILGGEDRAYGHDGDDRFFSVGKGDNLLTGGEGADQFWIVSDLPKMANIITDFTIDEDLFGIGGIGNTIGFDDLDITGSSNTTISVLGVEIAILQSISASSLSAENFVFS